VSAKYSQTLGKGYFGTANARGTSYTQVDAKLPLVKNLSAVAHYGRTNVANSSANDYNDINAGFVYSLPKAFDVSVKYFTNTSTTTAFETANTVNGQKLYKAITAVLIASSIALLIRRFMISYTSNCYTNIPKKHSTLSIGLD